jgi:hypothetical protein
MKRDINVGLFKDEEKEIKEACGFTVLEMRQYLVEKMKTILPGVKWSWDIDGNGAMQWPYHGDLVVSFVSEPYSYCYNGDVLKSLDEIEIGILHPNQVKHEGEFYDVKLKNLAKELAKINKKYDW